jgi:hypothetical protein
VLTVVLLGLLAGTGLSDPVRWLVCLMLVGVLAHKGLRTQVAG